MGLISENSSQARSRIAQRGEGHHGPDGAVRVLAAVFAHAGDVALDVAGVQRSDLSNGGSSSWISRASRRTRRRSTLSMASSDRSRVPAPERTDQLCEHRVDLAFRVGGRAERRAVVEVGAAIPFAVPAVLFDVAAQPAGFDRVLVGGSGVAALPGELGELREHVVQEEASQTLSPLPCCADQVHAVVPVAAAHQRQAVRAEAQAVVDRADAMLVERADVVGDVRQVVVGIFLRRAAAGRSGRARARRARRCRRSCAT